MGLLKKIESFRDLEVWQLSRRLACEVYQTTESFPQREWYGLASQMRRAAVSVASNIAEGFSRGTLPDSIHFLVIAHSSAVELEAQAILGSDLALLSSSEAESLRDLCVRVQKMLWKLEERLRVRQKTRINRENVTMADARSPIPE